MKKTILKVSIGKQSNNREYLEDLIKYALEANINIGIMCKEFMIETHDSMTMYDMHSKDFMSWSPVSINHNITSIEDFIDYVVDFCYKTLDETEEISVDN